MRAVDDGFEEIPCPYGPYWPALEEFDFITEQHGNLWSCYPVGKTPCARQIRTTVREIGRTKEETEEPARQVIAPKQKDQRRLC